MTDRDRWPNLRLMVSERHFYSLASAQAELAEALAVLDSLDLIVPEPAFVHFDKDDRGYFRFRCSCSVSSLWDASWNDTEQAARHHVDRNHKNAGAVAAFGERP